MRKPRPSDVLLLCLLAAMWGASFPAVKVAVAYLSTTAMVALRLIVGMTVMGTLAFFLGHRPRLDRATWINYVVVAAIGNLLPFLLIAHGQRQIDAGLGAILMATMPLATIVLAHLFTRDEKLTLRGVAGVLIGLVGILVLVGVDALKGLGADVLAQLCMAGAAMCYALHTILARRMSGSSSFTNAGCVLVLAAGMGVALMLATEGPPPALPLNAALAILFLGVFANGLAYLIYFRLTGTVGAGFTAMTNYLVPVMGVMWSALILGEVPSLRAIFALVLILGGVSVAHLRLGPKKS